MVDWPKISERIRQLMRAKQGLPIEDDVYQGLIHTNDSRERTKLTSHNIYRHNYLMVLADVGGEEWAICGKIAEGEQHLFISEEGLRATDFINSIARKKAEEQQVTNVNVAQPQAVEPEKKKGWFRR